MVQCYKCFNKGLKNRYDQVFKEYVVYHTDGKIKFGKNGNGFHMALRLEDTLKFFYDEKLMDLDDIDIAIVSGFGEIDEVPETYENIYSDNYDMYACEYMIIERVLSREEIIRYALNLDEYGANKFLCYFKINDFEKELFREKFKDSKVIIAKLDRFQDTRSNIILKR